MTITVLRARTILTMEPGAAPIEDGVVVIDGEEIVDVGPAEMRQRWPEVTVQDGPGQTIVPGFIDAHNHLSLTALHPLWADLTGVTDLDAVRVAMRASSDHVAASEHDPWVRAVGWNDRDLALTRADLDELEPDRPFVVAHFSYHECIVNSRALDEFGITASTSDPSGGRIGRDASGQPDGRLVERAWGEAHARSVRSYGDPDRWADLIVERCNRLRTEGITAVHDPACAPSAEAVYRRLAGERRLPISVLVMPHPEGILGDPDPARLDGPPTGEGDACLRVGPGKLFADGGSHPAIDGHIRGHHVRFGMGFDSVGDGIRRLVERGFGAAVHTMGNVMLDAVLDAFEHASDHRPDAAGPFRIEHVTLAGRHHVERMAASGVAGVVQPGFVQLLGALGANVRLDEATWMPFRSMLDAGVVLAGSSDDPCDVDAWKVLRSSHIGVTRRLPDGDTFDPDERVSMEDWLRAYTFGSATAGGQLDERGTISPGKRADLVVLDGEVQASKPPRVAQTWVAGTCVHREA